jgi:hypothetical protein
MAIECRRYKLHNEKLVFSRLFNLRRDAGEQRKINVSLVLSEERDGQKRDAYLFGAEGCAIFEYELNPSSKKLNISIYSQGTHESVRAVIEEDILKTRLEQI